MLEYCILSSEQLNEGSATIKKFSPARCQAQKQENTMETKQYGEDESLMNIVRSVINFPLLQYYSTVESLSLPRFKSTAAVRIDDDGLLIADGQTSRSDG
jgi:hypothetical protein